MATDDKNEREQYLKELARLKSLRWRTPRLFLFTGRPQSERTEKRKEKLGSL